MASSDDFDASLLRRLVVWLVAVKAAGMVVIFDPAGLDAFNLPKSIWSAGTQWLLLALLAAAFMRYGRAIIPHSRLHLFVTGFVAATALSAAFAENRYVALFGERDQYLGLAFTVDMFILYWAVAIAYRGVADWLVLGALSSLAALTAIAYASLQVAGLDPIRPEDGSMSRPSSSFGSPDIFGHYLSALFGAGCGVVVFASGRGSAFTRGIALCLATAVALTVGVVATRGSVLGFGTVLLVGALSYPRLRPGGWRSAMRATVIGACIGAVVVALLAASPLGQRAAETAAGNGIRDRLYIYASAVRAFEDRLIVGYGPDNFGVAYPTHRMAGITVVTGPGVSENSAHSWPLQMAATLGVVGLASFVALLLAFAAAVWTTGRRSPAIAGCAALATAGYLGHGLVNINAVSTDWMLWLAFAALASLAERRPAMLRHDSPRHAFAFATLLTVALAGALAGLPVFLANEDALIAELRWSEGLPADATLAAVSAVERDPGRADYWNWLGLALEQQKRWPFAGDAFAQAVQRAPHSATYWSNLARARTWQALDGDERAANASAALEAAHRAAAADPNAPEPNGVLAEIAYTFGQFDLALDAATRAIALNPSGEFDTLAAAAALEASNATEARRKLEDVVRLQPSASAHLAIAHLSLRLGDFDTARAHAERVLELTPDNVEAQGVISKATQ